MAGTIPQQHAPSRNRIDIISQILIRTENNLLIFRKTLYDLFCIGRRYHHVGQCFYCRTGIYVRNNRMAGMLFDKTCKLIVGTTIRQRTTGIQVGNQHFLVGTQNLCRFTHKVNPAHHNNTCIRLGSPLRQSQTVADEIGYLLNFVGLVVVPQYHRILFFLQSGYFRFQIDTLFYRFTDISLFQPFFFFHY